MEIKDIENQTVWDDFVTFLEDYTFLQSWNWGKFNQERGEKVWRLGLYDGPELIGTCQVLSVTARRGRFLFVPHGPLLRQFSISSLQFTINYLRKLAVDGGYAFVRISPWVESTDANKLIFKNLGFRDAPTIMHSEETWIVPIAKPEDEILAAMRKTHRNLIKRAQRDGVEIVPAHGPEDIKRLHELQMLAVERHKFVPFSQKYLEEEFEVFAKDNQCQLFLGKFNGDVLAAALIIFYGRFAYYLQSGSGRTNVPVNYLLQWEVIREAKKRGCEFYNLWGISAENRGNEGGLLMFKSGFGGSRKNYLHAKDLVLSPKYYLTYLLERVPRRWRALV